MPERNTPERNTLKSNTSKFDDTMVGTHKTRDGESLKSHDIVVVLYKYICRVSTVPEEFFDTTYFYDNNIIEADIDEHIHRMVGHTDYEILRVWR